MLTPGVGTPVEILRFAQDDTYKRFGIGNSDPHPRREDRRGLSLSGRGYRKEKGPVVGRALVFVFAS